MEIFFIAFGTIVAALTFYYQFQKQPKREVSDLKEMVLTQFKVNQKLSIDLKNNLEKYVSQTDSYDDPFLDWITFRGYINVLDKSQKTNLSDESFLKVKNLNSSNTILFQSFYDSLKSQYEELNKLNILMEIKLNGLAQSSSNFAIRQLNFQQYKNFYLKFLQSSFIDW